MYTCVCVCVFVRARAFVRICIQLLPRAAVCVCVYKHVRTHDAQDVDKHSDVNKKKRLYRVFFQSQIL